MNLSKTLLYMYCTMQIQKRMGYNFPMRNNSTNRKTNSSRFNTCAVELVYIYRTSRMDDYRYYNRTCTLYLSCTKSTVQCTCTGTCHCTCKCTCTCICTSIRYMYSTCTSTVYCITCTCTCRVHVHVQFDLK